jgi:hypothetical protein
MMPGSLLQYIFGELYKLLSLSLCNFIYPLGTSSFLHPNIMFSTLFSSHTVFLPWDERQSFTPIQNLSHFITFFLFLILKSITQWYMLESIHVHCDFKYIQITGKRLRQLTAVTQETEVYERRKTWKQRWNCDWNNIDEVTTNTNLKQCVALTKGHAHAHVCMHAHMRIHIHTHTHTHTSVNHERRTTKDNIWRSFKYKMSYYCVLV